MKTTHAKPTARWIPAAVLVILIVVVPLAVLALTEGVLRLAAYGVPATPFIDTTEAGYLTENPAWPALFHADTPRKTRQAGGLASAWIAKIKPRDTWRIVVLGGSTAQGFPYMEQHSFANIAGTLMDTSHPRASIEVINLAASAMSSYYVRETARHIWKLQPDAVVVYTGHNEYYGTISESSGRGHANKLTYIALKRFRVFQWLFSLFAPAVDPDATLMSERLAGGTFPPEETRDQRVADRLVDNLEAVRRLAAKNGVPLVVLEPVSNILSMPPFAGAYETELAELIEAGNQTLFLGNGDILAWIAAVHADHRAPKNAQILYLSAVAAAAAGETRHTAFTQAKDADALPFRARTASVQALRTWAESHPESVHYIPLTQELFAYGAEQSFGDLYFIDHLHFNFRGNMIVARILADTLADISKASLGLIPDQWPSAEEFRPGLRFHPALDAYAMITMATLMSQPPYSTMKVPFPAAGLHAAIRANTSLQNPDLGPLLTAQPEKTVPIVIEYLAGQQNLSELGSFLEAVAFVNPGDPVSQLQMAVFLDKTGIAPEQSLVYYMKAWLLSGRAPEIRSAAGDLADRHGLAATLQALETELTARGDRR